MADQTMKQKLRSAFSSLACRFCRGGGKSDSPTNKTEIVPLSSGWRRLSAENLPVLRQKCRNLIWRMGRGRRGGGTADFRYDPLSYAMNFEDEKGGGVDESPLGFRSMGFVARQPPCPLPEANRSSAIERS